MFGKKDRHYQNPNYGNPNQNPYQQEQQMQRMYYELEEQKRKLRNLNKRVRRIENYLGLRNEEIDDENYLED